MTLVEAVADGKGDFIRTSDKNVKYVSKEELVKMDEIILEGITTRLEKCL